MLLRKLCSLKGKPEEERRATERYWGEIILSIHESALQKLQVAWKSVTHTDSFEIQ